MTDEELGFYTRCLMVEYGQILVVIGVFPHRFGVAKGLDGSRVYPGFELVAHLVGPLKTLQGFPFHPNVHGLLRANVGIGFIGVHGDDTVVDQ